MELTVKISKRTLWLLTVAVVFLALWYGRGTIYGVGQKAAATDAALDAEHVD